MCYNIPKQMRETRCCHQTICHACTVKFISDSALNAGRCMYCRVEVPLTTVDTYTKEIEDQSELEEAHKREKSFTKV